MTWDLKKDKQNAGLRVSRDSAVSVKSSGLGVRCWESDLSKLQFPLLSNGNSNGTLHM